MLGAWGASWGATGGNGSTVINDGFFVEMSDMQVAVELAGAVEVLLVEPAVQVELILNEIIVEITE